MRTRATTPLLLVAALALGACGTSTATGGDATAVLRETAANLDTFDSGRLDVKMHSGVVGGDEAGFELSGPFDLPTGDGLAAVRFEHRRFDADRSRTTELISDGTEAWLVSHDERRPLTDTQAQALRVVTGSEGATLDVGRWIRGTPEVERDGDTDVVTADLDVAAVMDGLAGISRALGPDGGSGFEALSDQGAETLRRSTREAVMEVRTGAEDRLLRSVSFDVLLGPRDERIADPRVRIVFELSVSDVNESVQIDTD